LFLQVSPALPEGDTLLEQKGAQLIDDAGTARNKPAPNAVESLKVKLIVRLDRHKAYVRSLHCFGSSLGIKIVVLVGLQKRLYKLYRHEPNFVSQYLQRRTKKMSAAVRFYVDRTE